MGIIPLEMGNTMMGPGGSPNWQLIWSLQAWTPTQRVLVGLAHEVLSCLLYSYDCSCMVKKLWAPRTYLCRRYTSTAVTA